MFRALGSGFCGYIGGTVQWMTCRTPSNGFSDAETNMFTK